MLIYNTLSRKKEAFKPIHPGHVGIAPVEDFLHQLLLLYDVPRGVGFY